MREREDLFKADFIPRDFFFIVSRERETLFLKRVLEQYSCFFSRTGEDIVRDSLKKFISVLSDVLDFFNKKKRALLFETHLFDEENLEKDLYSSLMSAYDAFNSLPFENGIAFINIISQQPLVFSWSCLPEDQEEAVQGTQYMYCTSDVLELLNAYFSGFLEDFCKHRCAKKNLCFLFESYFKFFYPENF